MHYQNIYHDGFNETNLKQAAGSKCLVAPVWVARQNSRAALTTAQDQKGLQIAHESTPRKGCISPAVARGHSFVAPPEMARQAQNSAT